MRTHPAKSRLKLNIEFVLRWRVALPTVKRQTFFDFFFRNKKSISNFLQYKLTWPGTKYQLTPDYNLWLRHDNVANGFARQRARAKNNGGKQIILTTLVTACCRQLQQECRASFEQFVIQARGMKKLKSQTI